MANQPKWIERVLLIAIVWLALGLRLFQLDAVPHDYDRSYPHGVALALLDSAADGTFGRIALHGQAQSLGLPNPVGANYALALLALIDRSPYFAMLVIGTANTLVVAIAYSIARRTGGRMAGLAAAALAATSPWSVFYARGDWQLSLFELSVAVPAWLIWRGQILDRRGWVIAGFAAAAIGMQTYTVGFGLLPQLGAQMALMRRGPLKGRTVLLAGLAAGGLGLAMYAAVLLAAGVDLAAWRSARLAFVGEAYGGALAALPVNLLGVARTLGLVSGAEFEEIIITSARFADPARAGLILARSVFVAFAMAGGVIALARRWRAQRSARIVLAWLVVPAIAITAVTTLSRLTPVNHHYMLLGSPMGYVAGGIGIAALANLSLAKARQSMRPIVGAAWAAAVIAIMLIPLPSLGALIAQQLAMENIDTPLDLPLRAQLSVARAWKTHCAEMSVPFNPFEKRLELEYWAISLVGSKFGVRPTSEADFGAAQLWTTRADGGTCSIRMRTSTAPPGAAAHWDVVGAPVRIYQSEPAPALPPPEAARASIGWDLTLWTVPQDLRPGAPAQIDVAWQIAALPNAHPEPWRYDVFVKLVDASGSVVAQGDVLGPQDSAWRVGDIVRQRLMLALPADLKAGLYTVELSLYDRDRQRTASFSRSAITGANGSVLQLQTRVVR